MPTVTCDFLDSASLATQDTTTVLGLFKLLMGGFEFSLTADAGQQFLLDLRRMGDNHCIASIPIDRGKGLFKACYPKIETKTSTPLDQAVATWLSSPPVEIARDIARYLLRHQLSPDDSNVIAPDDSVIEDNLTIFLQHSYHQGAFGTSLIAAVLTWMQSSALLCDIPDNFWYKLYLTNSCIDRASNIFLSQNNQTLIIHEKIIIQALQSLVHPANADHQPPLLKGEIQYAVDLAKYVQCLPEQVIEYAERLKHAQNLNYPKWPVHPEYDLKTAIAEGWLQIQGFYLTWSNAAGFIVPLQLYLAALLPIYLPKWQLSDMKQQLCRINEQPKLRKILAQLTSLEQCYCLIAIVLLKQESNFSLDINACSKWGGISYRYNWSPWLNVADCLNVLHQLFTAYQACRIDLTNTISHVRKKSNRFDDLSYLIAGLTDEQYRWLLHIAIYFRNYNVTEKLLREIAQSKLLLRQSVQSLVCELEKEIDVKQSNVLIEKKKLLNALQKNDSAVIGSIIKQSSRWLKEPITCHDNGSECDLTEQKNVTTYRLWEIAFLISNITTVHCMIEQLIHHNIIPACQPKKQLLIKMVSQRQDKMLNRCYSHLMYDCSLKAYIERTKKRQPNSRKGIPGLPTGFTAGQKTQAATYLYEKVLSFWFKQCCHNMQHFKQIETQYPALRQGDLGKIFQRYVQMNPC